MFTLTEIKEYIDNWISEILYEEFGDANINNEDYIKDIQHLCIEGDDDMCDD